MPNTSIKIFDTTLRDGEQCPGASLNHAEKIKIALALEKLGVDIIEAGFPIASPDDFRAVKEIAKLVRQATVCGLARATKKDIEVTADAIKPARKKRIHTFLATSDLHLKFKLKLTRAQALAKITEMVSYARKLCPDVEFSPEDGSRTELKFLLQACQAAVQAGATTINIPDTVGYTVPAEFAKIVRACVKKFPKTIISVHCHDDLGLATANALAAVKDGARQVECTINGIGERAGNTPLEEVVMALKTRKKFFQNFSTKIKSKEIATISRLVADLTGFLVPPNKAIVGANAFAHESGIHQHGVLAKRETYEIMRAQDLGFQQNRLVLGKHSGRAALAARLENLGFKLNPQEIKEIFQRFKALADQKKEIFDEDLIALASTELSESEGVFHVDSVEIVSKKKKQPRATVTLINAKGKKLKQTCTGTGPVDAAYLAVNKITGQQQVKLLEFKMKAVTEGIDAQATTCVKIQTPDEQIITGHGSDTDIILASVKSYVHALNKYLQSKAKT